jgi:hypothetical protein
MCREHVSVVVVCPLVLHFVGRAEGDEVRAVGRAIGLDVHRDFCEVAIVESGALRSAGRIATTPEALELFAQSLAPTDRVALEVTGSAWEIARILEPHIAHVVVVSPADTGIRQARRRQTGWTRGRSRGCSRRASWTRSGHRMNGHAGCAGAWRGVSSWCVRARARRTRSTPHSCVG